MTDSTGTMFIRPFFGIIVALATVQFPANPAHSQQRLIETLPEQRELCVRSPEELPPAPVPAVGIPFTVSIESDNRIKETISLDEAIQIALRNAEVIRVLTGVSATNSGQTIYDVAINNTEIDRQASVFDPAFNASLVWNKRDGGIFPSSIDSIDTQVGLNKRLFNGGTVGLNVNSNSSYFEPGVSLLDPEYASSAALELSQPVMRGYGRAANLAPVVVARIDTERSYFRFKDSVQELVRGVIAAYWNLVGARVDVWARQQQVEQAEFAYQRALARQDKGFTQLADLAQARSALANFRASLITARSSLILAETALRNILGLDPSDTSVFVPTSLPMLEQVEFDWNEIVAIAEQYRPDVIELKLILQADRQNLLLADNQAKPQLDGIANYRWDGLQGELPSGIVVPDQAGRFAGFNLGVNFSVPMGLRRDRASLRRQELVLARDRANLEQGIFQMVQQLTINYRNLDQFFEQYVAFKEARAAARQNYENQAAEFVAGRREFINVLQAITDWGNAVSQEARSITQYNTELANVERQSGTILETHGIFFAEERYSSLGPRLFGLLRSDECYFQRINLDGDGDRYEESANSSDESFNLEILNPRRESSRPSNLNLLPDGTPAPETRPAPSRELPTEPKLELDPPRRPDDNGFPNAFRVIQPEGKGVPRLKATTSGVSGQSSRLNELFR